MVTLSLARGWGLPQVSVRVRPSLPTARYDPHEPGSQYRTRVPNVIVNIHSPGLDAGGPALHDRRARTNRASIRTPPAHQTPGAAGNHRPPDSDQREAQR